MLGTTKSFVLKKEVLIISFKILLTAVNFKSSFNVFW